MDKDSFLKLYPTLTCELYEFQLPDDATDEKIAQRLLENRGKNSLAINISTAAALVRESDKILENFDSQWEAFVEVANLADVERKDDARSWLKKLRGLWAKTLLNLEGKVK